eukprot:2655213-Prymnesium_polylepis.1
MCGSARDSLPVEICRSSGQAAAGCTGRTGQLRIHNKLHQWWIHHVARQHDKISATATPHGPANWSFKMRQKERSASERCFMSFSFVSQSEVIGPDHVFQHHKHEREDMNASNRHVAIFECAALSIGFQGASRPG